MGGTGSSVSRRLACSLDAYRDVEPPPDERADATPNLLREQDSDVWLLTGVPDDFILPGYWQHSTATLMGSGKHWAAVLSRTPLVPHPDPHGASA